MGLSSSKPRHTQYPLLTPGFTVPYGQNPNHYLPPHLQTTQATQSKTSSGKKKKRKSKGDSISSRERLAQAYVHGWHAGTTGMGPMPSHPSTRQAENQAPVIPPPPLPQPQPAPGPISAPVIPPLPDQPARTQTPFSASGSAFVLPQRDPVPPPPNHVQQPPRPPSAVQQQHSTIARVLQPLPPPNPSAYGPPPPQQPLPPLANPLPTPPRDLYELSPYNTLLNLPQTTALLTAAYSQQQGGIPPPNSSFGRRSGSRTGGLLRALTGRGRKEEDVRFVPVFINGQSQPMNPVPQNPVNPVSTAPVPAQAVPTPAPPRPSVSLHDPPVPQFSPQPGSSRRQSAGSARRQSTGPAVASQGRGPTLFSFDTPDYHGFLNYSPHRIVYQDRTYPTAMHLHEALKYMPTNPAYAERIRLCPKPEDVYTLSTQLENQSPSSVRADWPTVYLESMRQVILLKFRQHADLRVALLSTGDSPLVYDDPDPYWGGGGYNHLGHILEQVRVELRRDFNIPT
ncbi:S5A-reductase domain-containing protein [Favolaschia claudopus]|uniref:S5A-reductase domain-containing protein n=1 Tax=Favolaschia claudopus TaxID=2862362 RepID=A0AAW0BX25_9AGAR